MMSNDSGISSLEKLVTMAIEDRDALKQVVRGYKTKNYRFEPKKGNKMIMNMINVILRDLDDEILVPNSEDLKTPKRRKLEELKAIDDSSEEQKLVDLTNDDIIAFVDNVEGVNLFK